MHLLVLLSLLASLPLSAALLPEALGEFERQTVEPFQPAELSIFNEFGLEEAERARFTTAAGERVVVTASRFQDPTGAFAAYLWLVPAKGQEVPFGERGFQSGDITLIHFGNYVIRMKGVTPLDDHVELMLTFLPRVQMTAAPPLLAYFPTSQLVPNSTRYILGPASLEELAPEIPPSVAAFHFGTEAEYGRFTSDSGEHELLLFSYPTPQIARDQVKEFNELPKVVAKRAGPLVAVVPSPPSADEAERLLARVRYAAEVTTHHRELGRHEDLVTLIIDIIIFCGVLVGLMIVGGCIVAGTRMLAGRYAPNSIFAPPDDLGIVKLDIDER